MNMIQFDVYKNTVQRHGGFNPVASEKNYTKLRFKFKKDDSWENCNLITAMFFVSADERVKSDVAMMENSLSVEFNIPSEFVGIKEKLYIGLQGIYENADGESVTLATNIIGIDVVRGLLVEENAPQNIYEKLLIVLEKGIKNFITLLDTKADKATTLEGYGITDAIKNDTGTVKTKNLADEAVTYAKLAKGAVTIDRLSVFVKQRVEDERLVNIEYHGAVAGKNSDDACDANKEAFDKAVAAAKENGFDGVYIPNKYYYFKDTIEVENISDLKIHNSGTLYMRPHKIDGTEINRPLFKFKNCNRITFDIGIITSKKDAQEGTPPNGFKRIDTTSSNIVAFRLKNCKNMTFQNGYIWNMEYAAHLEVLKTDSDQDVKSLMSNNIVFKDLTVADTAQPFLVNMVENIEFNHITITSRTGMSAGDHFLYICDSVNHVVVRDCMFTYTDMCFGSAINLRNSWVQSDGVNHETYDVKNVEIYNTQVLNCPSTYFVTAKGESKVLIQGCKFEYTNLSLSGEARGILKKEKNGVDPSEDEVKTRESLLENKRRAFLFGEKNQTQGTEITVTDTSIVEPINYPQGQLISGFDRRWTAIFRNCTIKSGSICSHLEGGSPEKDSTPEDQTGAALEFHNCKMEFSRWMIVFRAYTKRVFKLLNCDIATRGDAYQIRTPHFSNDGPGTAEVTCIGCNFTNTSDKTNKGDNTDTSDKANTGDDMNTGENTESKKFYLFNNTAGSNVRAVNNTAEGFEGFVDTSYSGDAVLSNNVLF